MDSPRITTQSLALFAAMLDDPSSSWYGLELSKRASLKGGTIYPTLARFERAGWLESHWEEIDPSAAGRPRRRLYQLTPEGAERARELLEEHARRLAPRGKGSLADWLPRVEGQSA